jgi:hypothetical protein
MEITLLRTLHWFPIKFFVSSLSSYLKRYSKLCFARSPYLVQIFEFPLVEHLLTSPRSHTYRSIDFCSIHCENSRIWGRTACTGLTGARHLSDQWWLSNPRFCFLHVFDPYLCRNASSSSLSISWCPSCWDWQLSPLVRFWTAPVWPVPLTGLTGEEQNRPNCLNLSISISILFKSLSWVLYNPSISFVTQECHYAKVEAIREQEIKVDT